MSVKMRKEPWFTSKIRALEQEVSELRSQKSREVREGAIASRPPVSSPPNLASSITHSSTTSGGIHTNGGTTTPMSLPSGELQRAGEEFNLDSYCKGFYDCMSKYAIFAKGARRRIVETIKQRYKGNGDTKFVWRVK